MRVHGKLGRPCKEETVEAGKWTEAHWLNISLLKYSPRSCRVGVFFGLLTSTTISAGWTLFTLSTVRPFPSVDVLLMLMMGP